MGVERVERREVVIRVEFEKLADDKDISLVTGCLRERIFGDAGTLDGNSLRFPAGNSFDLVVTDPGFFGEVYCAAMDINLNLNGVVARVLGKDGEPESSESPGGDVVDDTTKRDMRLHKDGVTEDALKRLMAGEAVIVDGRIKDTVEYGDDDDEPFKD